jgi:hypothetical protein
LASSAAKSEEVSMGIIRDILWFEKGELQEIAGKMTAQKWGYETRWEVDVIVPLVLLIPLAFYANLWLGFLAVWAVKAAFQSLNKKRFFDPIP